MRTRFAQLIGLFVLATTSHAGGSDDLRVFYALFYDGSHVSVPALPRDVWSSSEPMLGGRRLFGTVNPVRMVQQWIPRVTLKRPRIEMANGDVIPGKVTGFYPGSEASDTPAQFVIAPDCLLNVDPRGLIVRADRVLRITTAAETTNSEKPGSLLLANGARLNVRAMRWTDQGLKAFTERGLTAVSFDEIADFCLPKADRTTAVLDDAFFPPLGPDVVIGRLETIDGAVLTYHCQMSMWGESKVPPPTRYLLIQPNWSAGVILVPIDSIWRQSFRSAREVPLSLLPATTQSERTAIHRWPWRRNTNVEGDILASGNIAVDLGIGTHACCEIAFDLPAQANEFTALVGIDRCIAPGAAAIGRISSDQASGSPLFFSKSLRSGQEPTPIGPAQVSHCRKLVLGTDWADKDRPLDAYPLDIGGHVNWLMPFVTIHTDDASYYQSLRRFLPGWASWDVALEDARKVHVGLNWDAARESWFSVLSMTGSQPLTFRRTLSPVSAANDRIELSFAQYKNSVSPVIELKVDGVFLKPVAGPREDGKSAKLGPLPVKPALRKAVVHSTRSLDSGQQYRPRTMYWDLGRYHGQSVQLTLTVFIGNQLKGLAWRGLATMPAGASKTASSK